MVSPSKKCDSTSQVHEAKDSLDPLSWCYPFLGKFVGLFSLGMIGYMMALEYVTDFAVGHY